MIDRRIPKDMESRREQADHQAFDLLISDLGLPSGSGHDLMRKLRERGHKLPGIALTGYGQEEDIQRSREAGFAAHLTKPASRERLLKAIALHPLLPKNDDDRDLAEGISEKYRVKE